MSLHLFLFRNHLGRQRHKKLNKSHAQNQILAVNDWLMTFHTQLQYQYHDNTFLQYTDSNDKCIMYKVMHTDDDVIFEITFVDLRF